MKKKRIIIIVIAGVLVLLGLGAFMLGIFKKEAIEVIKDEPVYSQLTGMEVGPDIAKKPILGIIIENTEQARPQTGLGSAGIVFEALTEGGITRYLALYQENEPETAGPIRSLRPHFLDWAMGFDVSFAHVGGSATALEQADKRDAKSLNEFKHNGSYFRDSKKQAPHNVFARLSALRELQDSLGHKTSQFKIIPRSADNPAENPDAATITLDYSFPAYRVEFRYDSGANSYTRYLSGKPHIDQATQKAISAKNIVVIKTKVLEAVGSGEAIIFKDGRAIQARWQKPDFGERLQIIGVGDNEDGEIPLNRGNTWISAIPSSREVTY